MYLYKEKDFYGMGKERFSVKVKQTEEDEDFLRRKGKVDWSSQGEKEVLVSIQVAYWRKANQIHNWFVQHCGGGEDNCQRIYVSREDLEELLKTCKKVLKSCELEESWSESFGGFCWHDLKDKIQLIKQVDDHFEKAGEKLAQDLKVGDLFCREFSKESGNRVSDVEIKEEVIKVGPEKGQINTVVSISFDSIYRHKTLKDPRIAKELLPTCEGFFFGDTNYDEWYVEDLKDTIKVLEEILSEDDGDYNYYYEASW